MPTHVHAGVTPAEDIELKTIVGAWKSYSAHRINTTLGRRGRLWQRGSYDRWVRDERHFKVGVRYIHDNRLKGGLCAKPEDWPWSSAGSRPSFAACKPPVW